MPATIERARRDDLASVLARLRRHALPLDGAQFFLRFGFERITLDDVPESVRQSIEFQSACPASAIVMRHRMGTAL